MLHFWLMHWLFEKRFYTWFYAFNVTPNRRSQCKSIFNTSSRKLITILEGFIPMWRRIQQKVLKRSAIVTSALLQSSKNHARKIKKDQLAIASLWSHAGACSSPLGKSKGVRLSNGHLLLRFRRSVIAVCALLIRARAPSYTDTRIVGCGPAYLSDRAYLASYL